MEIKRDFYLSKLIAKRENGFIKVITGLRRCGKSYLLNTIFYRYLLDHVTDASHIIRFAFDSADDLEQIGESLLEIEQQKRKVNPEKFLAFIRTQMTDSGMYYLLLDEIQLLDCFESVLNGYLRKDNMDVFVTGSNAKMLSSDIVTEFAGRGDKIELHPLSFSEFMSVYHGDVYNGFSEYMTYGGIPLVCLQKNKEDKVEILENLFSEIYIRDILKRNRLKNQLELEQLLDLISSAIGSLSNPEKIKNSFHSLGNSKITTGTIQKYLNCLEDAFLLHSAKRYDLKGKAYLKTPLKYYMADAGLRNARMHFRQLEYTHLMENTIYNELITLGFQVDVGVIPVRHKNPAGKREEQMLEIDFVCNKGDKRFYIQSAYSLPDENKRTQEIRPFISLHDSFRKIVLTRDYTEDFMDENGIMTVNVYSFLKNPMSYLS